MNRELYLSNLPQNTNRELKIKFDPSLDKGGYYSESAIQFLDHLQISKTKYSEKLS